MVWAATDMDSQSRVPALAEKVGILNALTWQGLESIGTGEVGPEAWLHCPFEQIDPISTQVDVYKSQTRGRGR